MKGVRLFRILGIRISINYTWFIIFGLIAWSLGGGYFPYHYPGLNPSAHWVMGFLGTVFLLLNVLAHKVTDSYIARGEGIEVKEVPGDQRAEKTVREVMIPIRGEMMLDPEGQWPGKTCDHCNADAPIDGESYAAYKGGGDRRGQCHLRWD